MRQKLNSRERAFVLKYLGEANGVGSVAAGLAGYTGSPNVLKATASRLLTRVNVRAAMKTIQDAREKAAIAKADERDLMLSSIARNGFYDPLERIAAIKELNKVEGRHSLTLKLKGKLTLVEAMGISRDLEAGDQ